MSSSAQIDPQLCQRMINHFFRFPALSVAMPTDHQLCVSVSPFHDIPAVLNSSSPLSVCVSPSYIFFIALSIPMLLVHFLSFFLLPGFSIFISVFLSTETQMGELSSEFSPPSLFCQLAFRQYRGPPPPKRSWVDP